ncbi:signal peptidase I [Aureibacillus halotolerans]|uniref:Signal peptidase I n=1 Tax=Aureibacillus halotolerans TaxID=1508390 RepID=A0A4R6U6C7_9BACI|nr:signal peptidase I [Aureibacillus halotolerans]TDQ42058.1 signal peptidase I [Aureibacillus halotolerans]
MANEPLENEEADKEKKKSGWFDWVKTIGIALIAAIIIRTFLFSSYAVDGSSMETTLHDGDLLIINKIGYTVGDIDRFDVVVFHFNEQDDYVKRVIGLPGDHVVYKDDQLFINDEPYDEPYLEGIRAQSLGKLMGDLDQTVPPGSLFVLGDNRRGSSDSRHFGFVPIEHVVGQVSLRFWPLNDFDFNFYS